MTLLTTTVFLDHRSWLCALLQPNKNKIMDLYKIWDLLWCSGWMCVTFPLCFSSIVVSLALSDPFRDIQSQGSVMGSSPWPCWRPLAMSTSHNKLSYHPREELVSSVSIFIIRSSPPVMRIWCMSEPVVFDFFWRCDNTCLKVSQWNIWRDFPTWQQLISTTPSGKISKYSASVSHYI